MHLPRGQLIPLFIIFPKEMETSTLTLQKALNTNIHSDFIHKSQKLEVAQKAVSQRTDFNKKKQNTQNYTMEYFSSTQKKPKT